MTSSAAKVLPHLFLPGNKTLRNLLTPTPFFP
jgi:hypothetical protein